MEMITEIPAADAVRHILKEIAFYKKNGVHRNKEQVADLIADYSDNEERTFIISMAIWLKLKKDDKI